jgi:hypothetical protein
MIVKLIKTKAISLTYFLYQGWPSGPAGGIVLPAAAAFGGDEFVVFLAFALPAAAAGDGDSAGFLANGFEKKLFLEFVDAAAVNGFRFAPARAFGVPPNEGSPLGIVNILSNAPSYQVIIQGTCSAA